MVPEITICSLQLIMMKTYQRIRGFTHFENFYMTKAALAAGDWSTAVGNLDQTVEVNIC